MEGFGELYAQPESIRRGVSVGVIPNTDKDAGLAYTREVCAFLAVLGVKPLLAEKLALAAELPALGVAEDRLYRDASFVAVLGGDGTMLRTSHMAAFYDTPMLGINLGTLGYLTDVDRHDGLTALKKVLTGVFRSEKRLTLSLTPETTGSLMPTERLALNDVCLSRGAFGKLITFDLYLNGLYMDTLRADGVIVATPTGSTAYNLSAGGPILTPDGEMMVVTAVCPHALYTRPWVISAGDTVEIRPADEPPVMGYVAVDGETRLTVKRGDRIVIRRSDYDVSILKTTKMNFYEILRRKIGCETPGS